MARTEVSSHQWMRAGVSTVLYSVFGIKGTATSVIGRVATAASSDMSSVHGHTDIADVALQLHATVIELVGHAHNGAMAVSDALGDDP